MERGIGWLIRLIEIGLVILLGGMAAMVFINVVLRYGFNTGITFSEEAARYFFVWLTFIGAVVTFRENAHLGVETMVRLFGRRGRLVCMLITNLLIILCMVVLFRGTWLQAPINASMVAPVTGMPMIWIFGVTFFTSVGIGLIALVRVARILTGKISEEEIASFAGEFEENDIGARAE
jgi:TRAP-type C4-dicarboxylate transport system permease small subunit